jgi:DNA-binding response OmpR family regulator
MAENSEIGTRLSPSQRAEPSTFGQPEKARILYVEDDADTREMVTLMLTLQGYKVASASSCGESIQLAKEGSYDLYILDYTLPDGSGLSLCQQLRAVNSDAPILFCSGWSTENHITAATDNGARDYLTKPFTAKELLTKVSRLLRA